MRRSIASVLVGALVLPTTVLNGSAAHAHHRDKPTTVGVTVKTDAMPTRVEVTSVSGRVACVRIAAGSGRDRRIWVHLDGRRPARLYTRLAAGRSSKCLFTGAALLKGSRLTIRVEEDMPGPFDLQATATLR